MKQEPAVTTSAITAAVTAIIALVVAFGLPITDQQAAAILGVVAVVGPLVAGFVTRRHVTPNTTVVARRSPPTDTTAG